MLKLLFLASFVSFCFANSGYKTSLEIDYGQGFKHFGIIHFMNMKGSDITLTDLQQLPISALDNNEDFIRIRTSTNLKDITSSNTDDKDTNWIMTSLPMIEVIKTTTLGSIHLQLDGFGSIISLSFYPSVLEGTSEDFLQIDQDVVVSVPEQAAIPDTVAYLAKIEKERQQRESPAKENKSFLAKYWMYILPAVIFFIIQNASQQ